MKEIIADALYVQLEEKLDKSQIEQLIEIPPDEEMGDFAFPCFSLARIYKKKPAEIAREFSETLKLPDLFEKVIPVSGYLNFFLNKNILAKQVLGACQSDTYGSKNLNKKIVIEFASPNTNKPLHLGHLRNISIGESISRLFSFCGNKVTRASINNDRGVHICKSMLAYDLLSEGKTPENTGKKSDHFVGDYYVLFSKKASEDETWNGKAQELLRKWETGDEHTVKLWKTMNKWALEGFAQTYRLFGISFDKEYFESDIYKSGKEIVNEGLEKKVFYKRDDGAVVVDLEHQKLGNKVLLRPDGTSVYIVQDLYLAVLKDREFNYDRSIYVVGNEQEYHFAVLIAIFKLLDYPVADKMKHLSYGMVELPEGKMKSREGTVVDADDLIDETKRLASEELKQRYELSESELEERSLKIALSAIKYQLLKIDITKNMLFDPKKAISFEGDTGPYLLYSYARASSILRKTESKKDAVFSDLNVHETRLARKISFFPDTVTSAFERLSPSVIANYAFDLAQIFNEFYHACKVIGSDSEGLRIELVKGFRSVLKKCLWLLGIEEIEEM